MPTDEKCPCESREKYWSELTPDEKIERLREQVKSVMALVSDQSNSLEHARAVLMQHTHNPIGQLLVPANEFSRARHTLNSLWRDKPGVRKDDQVYF